MHVTDSSRSPKDTSEHVASRARCRSIHPSIHPSTQSNRTLCACIRLMGERERERYKARLGRNVDTYGTTQWLEKKMKNKQSTAENADQSGEPGLRWRSCI